MSVSSWQSRIQRARELAAQHPFAAEILGFYIHVTRAQEDLHQRWSAEIPQTSKSASISGGLSRHDLKKLSVAFNSFLSVAEAHGPKALAELSRELRGRGQESWIDLLSKASAERSSHDAEVLLALAFLQPYAELLRFRSQLRPVPTAYAVCPFCNRKPALGVLRQMGDGGARSMLCSFCLAEWEFRRIVCPGCGEESDKQLAVFTASDFEYIRVECCDSCKTYIKTVDLTKNGRAHPVVDELASAPLDFWAREQGYVKLQTNLLGM